MHSVRRHNSLSHGRNDRVLFGGMVEWRASSVRDISCGPPFKLVDARVPTVWRYLYERRLPDHCTIALLVRHCCPSKCTRRCCLQASSESYTSFLALLTSPPLPLEPCTPVALLHTFCPSSRAVTLSKQLLIDMPEGIAIPLDIW